MAKRPRKASNVPADESKAAKFIRLATPRMTKLLKTIDAIGKLSAKAYEYTPDQVAAMDKAVKAAWNASHARFSADGSKTDAGGFSFT